MHVSIIRQPATPIASIRAYGPYETSAAKAWKKLSPWIASQNILTEKTRFLGLRHDCPSLSTPISLRYDAAVTLPAPLPQKTSVDQYILEEGEFAVVTHKGSYSTLQESWTRLYWEWLPNSSRLTRNAPCMEVFLSTPRPESNEEMNIRLYLPLEPLY